MTRPRKKRSESEPKITIENLSVPQSKRSRSTQERRALALGTTAIPGPPVQKAVRVALYLRVSSSRSVESNLSLPEQEKQLRKYCKERGWVVVAVYEEAGKSAKTTNRPKFRMMVSDAQALERPFDVVLIWTTSRFARSSIDYALVEKLLRLHGIEVLSVSQSFARNAGGFVAKRVTTMFDEYHSIRSAEDSINARRHMVEDGFWPGGMTPDGYKLLPAPDQKGRMVVAIDEDRRPVIERIYSLALHGDGQGPRLGVKAIAMWLNTRRIWTRTGSRWSNQAIHRILTCSSYFGDHYWGVDPAISEHRDEQDPVLLKIPATISRSMFEEVQLMLGKRNPKMRAAKQVSSPLLLSGIAHCEECGKAMTLRTGKSYRYYHCSSANRGTMVCSGPAIPEKQLDDAVVNTVRSRVLDRDHLENLLSGLQRRERSRAMSLSQEMPALRSRVSAAEAAIEGFWASLRLAPSLEHDPLFQKNLKLAAGELELARAKVDDALEAMDEAGEVGEAAIQLFRDQILDILDGPNVHRRKIYLESIVQRVEVGQTEIRIEGHIEDLRKAVEASASGSGSGAGPEVRRYVRKWRWV